MSVERCHDCGASLGTLAQETMLGVEKRCPPCERNWRGKSYLALLPDPGDGEWEDLNEWEQKFLGSVRRQFSEKGSITEKQFEVLTRLYEGRLPELLAAVLRLSATGTKPTQRACCRFEHYYSIVNRHMRHSELVSLAMRESK